MVRAGAAAWRTHNLLQDSVIADIFDLVDEVPGSLDGSQEGSFREILRGRAGYAADTTQRFLAPYQPTLLAVSLDTSQAPFARDIVSDEARSNLDGIERMMRPEEQTNSLDSLYGAITSYIDPVLKRSRRHYVCLPKRLHAAVVCLEPAEFVGIFVVYKQNRQEGHSIDSWCPQDELEMCFGLFRQLAYYRRHSLRRDRWWFCRRGEVGDDGACCRGRQICLPPYAHR